jgi:hypothetical protein
MNAPLILIQSAARGEQLQQALDAALVNSIFHEGCLILVLIEQQAFIHLCELFSLEEVLEQLRDLNASLVFSQHLPPLELRACLEKAGAVLAF